MKALESVDILCAPVRTLAEALEDEQTLVNRMIVEMEHPTAGTVRTLEAPIHLSATPASVRRVPPRLGEHNAEVLRDHGFTRRDRRADRGEGAPMSFDHGIRY